MRPAWTPSTAAVASPWWKIPQARFSPKCRPRQMKATRVDFILAVDGMGLLLEKLVREPLSEPPAVPGQIAMEARLAEKALASDGHSEGIADTASLGQLTPYTCPDCGGALWKMDGQDRLRCHVGHAYTLAAYLAEQGSNLELTLWARVRSLEARAKILENLAASHESRRLELGSGFSREAQECRQHASRIRELLARLNKTSQAGPSENSFAQPILNAGYAAGRTAPGVSAYYKAISPGLRPL